MTKIKKNILLIDSEKDYNKIIKEYIGGEYSLTIIEKLNSQIDLSELSNVDVIIIDIDFIKESNKGLLDDLKKNTDFTEIIILTHYKSIESAINVLQTDIEEFLVKPFTKEALLFTLERAINKTALKKKKIFSNDPINTFYGLIGQSKPMQDVYNKILKAASSDANVLITGESGTGKELVARAIHYISKRGKSPFVVVHCGGIPETLLESELFGHEKGSFTGASERKEGFLQTAESGSIFLDEISEATLNIQVKLLRAVQEKEYFMIGSRISKNADIRIISASNKNLLTLIESGSFREDLYYRLNVIPIELPPLRERKRDIILLIEYFLQKFSTEAKKDKISLTENAMDVLINFSWPGNVRELKNIINRLVVLSEKNLIDLDDLPDLIRKSNKEKNHVIRINKTLAEVEKEYISKVLEFTENNKSYAAKILNIDRKTLWEKLKKYEDKVIS